MGASMAQGADHDPFTPGFSNLPRVFAGRKAEFADLEQMLARISNGTYEQVRMITGNRGLGKTTLLREQVWPSPRPGRNGHTGAPGTCARCRNPTERAGDRRDPVTHRPTNWSQTVAHHGSTPRRSSRPAVTPASRSETVAHHGSTPRRSSRPAATPASRTTGPAPARYPADSGRSALALQRSGE